MSHEEPRVQAQEIALGEIDAGLKRIHDGSYGVCEFTGKAIPRPRLEAIPWARGTVEAQAQLEDKGQAPRAHLNDRESVRPPKQWSLNEKNSFHVRNCAGPGSRS